VRKAFFMRIPAPSAPMEKSMNRRIVMDLIADYRRVEWAETAVLQDHAQARSFSGPQAIRDWLRALFEEGFPHSRIDIHRVIADGNGAAAEYTLRGRQAGPFAGIRPTGHEVALPMVFICEIREGRISLANLYYDTGTLLRQLDLALKEK
jgi:predicted ester cyclase